MKNLLAILGLFLVLTGSTFAQKGSSEFMRESNNYHIGIGPIVGYKFGVNAADTQEGIKNALGLASMPDFGAQFYLPLDPENKMGMIIEAVYANYPYGQKFDASDVEWTDRFNYLALGANFHISGFTIGMNFGFPMSGFRVFDDRELEIEASSLNTMLEFRIGGNFTLNESNAGRLILFINAGYQINGQYTDEVNYGVYNPHPASLQLGLGYLFNMQ